VSFTRVQYALLKLWADGRFQEDWTFGDVRIAPVQIPGPVTPHGLDRAAAENRVGGPFYPGIEISWLIRHPSIHHSAFRLHMPAWGLKNVGPIAYQPGFFSQQMALPWTADFYDCHKEEHSKANKNAHEEMLYMWWTANRPDDFRAQSGEERQRWVGAFDAANNGDDPKDPDGITNLNRFEQMRTRWPELNFIVLENEEYVAQKATPAANPLARRVVRGG
jgi:hypothetical protein